MTCWCAQTSETPTQECGHVAGHEQDALCTGFYAGCVWVTLSQAVPAPCQGWTSSSSQAAQETRVYLNPGFSCAASQQDPVTSPLSEGENAACGSLLGHGWGKRGLVSAAVAGCRRWWGVRSKGRDKGKAKEQASGDVATLSLQHLSTEKCDL